MLPIQLFSLVGISFGFLRFESDCGSRRSVYLPSPSAAPLSTRTDIVSDQDTVYLLRINGQSQSHLLLLLPGRRVTCKYNYKWNRGGKFHCSDTPLTGSTSPPLVYARAHTVFFTSLMCVCFRETKASICSRRICLAGVGGTPSLPAFQSLVGLGSVFWIL